MPRLYRENLFQVERSLAHPRRGNFSYILHEKRTVTRIAGSPCFGYLSHSPSWASMRTQTSFPVVASLHQGEERRQTGNTSVSVGYR